MNDYSDVLEGLEDICRRTFDVPGLLARSELDEGPSSQDTKELVDFGLLALAIPEAAGGLEMDPTGIALTGLLAGRYLLPLHVTNAMLVAAPALAAGPESEAGALLEDLVGGKIGAAVAFDPLAPAVDGATQLAYVPSDAQLFINARPDRLSVYRFDESSQLSSIEGLDAGQGLQLLSPRDDNGVAMLALDGSAAARIWRLWQLGLCAQALGCASYALQQSAEYAKQREQFGVPIASFQAVAHMLAEMYVGVASGESILSRTAHSLNAGSDEALTDLTSLAHWLPARARKVCELAVQVHGGNGFTWELGLHLYYRRVLTIQALLGGDRGSARQVARSYLQAPSVQAGVLDSRAGRGA